VNIDPVADVNGNLGQMLVGAMHGVAKLQGGHVFPASFLENFPGVGRTVINIRIPLGIITFGQDLDRAGQVELLLVHDHLDTGVIVFGDFPELFGGGGAFAHEDFFTFVLFVLLGHLVLFSDLHGGQDVVLFGIIQGDLVAFLDLVGVFLGGVQADRYRPEGTVGQQVAVADTFPVGLGHKTGQGAEAAVADHDQVAFGAGAQFDLFQAFGFFLFRFQLTAFEQAGGQSFSAMRCNQLTHW